MKINPFSSFVLSDADGKTQAALHVDSLRAAGQGNEVLCNREVCGANRGACLFALEGREGHACRYQLRQTPGRQIRRTSHTAATQPDLHKYC